MLSHISHVQLFVTLWTVAHQALLSMDSPGKITGVGCRALLQGIFPTQGSNHVSYISFSGRQVIYDWRHLGSPNIYCHYALNIPCPLLVVPIYAPMSSSHHFLKHMKFYPII